MKSHKNINN